MSRPLLDDAARERIRTDIGQTLIVEAAAGTGKTTVLIARIITLLSSADDIRLQNIVAVTFTERAAGEMKLRLRTEVERARIAAESPVVRARLDRALYELETARISTIHALCGDLLRERPIEAGVDPQFDIGADGRTERLYDQAFDRWLREAIAQPKAFPGVRRVLRRATFGGGGSDGPIQALRSAGWALAERQDYPAPWEAPDYDREASILGLLATLKVLAKMVLQCPDPADNLAQALEPIAQLARDIARREALNARYDLDELEAALRGLTKNWNIWKRRGTGRYFAKDLERRAVLDQREAFHAALDRFVELADADVAARLREEMRGLVERLESLKESAGILGFLDLLLRTRDMLIRDAVVRGALQRRFKYVLIDEFQDTNPLQAEILLLLTADDPDETQWERVRPSPGKLFVVGDPKQSIYRFRRADVALYERIKLRLVAHGAEVLQLQTCFRCRPAIAHAVNAAFSLAMTPTEDHSQTAYMALDPFRADATDQPGVIALPVPAPYNARGYVGVSEVEKSYPEAVASFVGWLVQESGWTVEEGGAMVPIEPRHVCLISRRLQKSWGSALERDLARRYTRELEARQIPHVLVGGRSYHVREEVVALRTALTAIEWPDDELSVFATMRGPLFAIDDASLLIYREWGRGDGAQVKLRPLKAAYTVDTAIPGGTRIRADDEPAAIAVVDEALAVLGRLHHDRNRRPIADTVTALLDATRAHAGLAFWPGGEQVLANALRVVDQARDYEAMGASSFRGFIRHLTRAAERGDTGDAPLVEDGTQGVRIMTAHSAKGLEFPVVILCDPTAPATFRTAGSHVDPAKKLWAVRLAGCTPLDVVQHGDATLKHEAHEAVRLAYVAATRARDLLVLPVVADQPIEGWLQAMAPALFPGQHLSAVAPGCPPLGHETVKVCPPAAVHRLMAATAPGLVKPRKGEHKVVWWGTDALTLDVKAPEARSRHELLRDATSAAAQKAASDHAAWRDERARVTQAGSVPTLPGLGFGEYVGQLDDTDAGDARLTVTRLEVDRSGRPRGARFGTLVHLILSHLPWDAAADPDVIGPLAESHGAILGASAREVAAAADVAAHTWAHPLMREASAASQRLREVPVFLTLPNGQLGDGVIDLVFRREPAAGDAAATWVVIDFKTQRDAQDTPSGRDRLGLYCDAVSQAASEPAVGVLLML